MSERDNADRRPFSDQLFCRKAAAEGSLRKSLTHHVSHSRLNGSGKSCAFLPGSTRRPYRTLVLLHDLFLPAKRSAGTQQAERNDHATRLPVKGQDQLGARHLARPAVVFPPPLAITGRDLCPHKSLTAKSQAPSQAVQPNHFSHNGQNDGRMKSRWRGRQRQQRKRFFTSLSFWGFA